MQILIGKFNLYLLTEKRASANTAIGYIRDVDFFADFITTHNINFYTMTVEQLRWYIKYIAHYEPATRARKISAVKAFFLFLETHHNITNIAAHLEMPRLEEKLPHYITEKDIKILFRVLKKESIRDQLLVSLLYGTGARISEVVNLKRSDVSLDSKIILFMGKRNKYRYVPFPASLVKLFKKHFKQSQSVYVFSTIAHIPMSRQNGWTIIKRIWAKTNILKPLWPHQMRHTYATHMLKRGANLRQLQALLGHERLSSVEIYTHLDMSHIRKQYDKKHPRA